MVVSLVHINWEPSRVMINEHYDAVPPNMAKGLGVEPDIIFVRKDGWSLGAPKSLESHAYFIWKNDWTQFIRKGEKDWTDISEYLQ